MIDIKSFREKNGLLQKDLAEYLGVSIAFISAVEKGQSKLPGEKLTKLLDNENGWDTDYLISGNPRLRPYYDFKTMHGGQDFGGGQFNAPIYCGSSEEDIERIVKLNMAEYEAENRSLRVKVQSLSNENAFLRTVCRELLAAVKTDSPIKESILIEAGLGSQIQENIVDLQKNENQ